MRLTGCLSVQEKKLRQQKKAKLAARTKLSFAQDEDEEDDAGLNGSAEVRLHARPVSQLLQLCTQLPIVYGCTDIGVCDARTQMDDASTKCCYRRCNILT